VSEANPTPALPTRGYANYVLAVMVLMYSMNYLDRFVLTILITDIQADLQISDTMAGFLGRCRVSPLHHRAGAHRLEWLHSPVGHGANLHGARHCPGVRWGR
jgi:hypothetical protein